MIHKKIKSEEINCFWSAGYHLLSSVADPRHVGVNPDPRIHASDQWIRILLFSSMTFKMPTKN
jgi:hypothetical protein